MSGNISVNNKAILLRSVSTLATAAASTALGVHGAQAQVVPAGTDGYYYSVQGGMALSKSEQFLTGLNDKLGYTGSGSSSYSSAGFSSFSSYDTFALSGSSFTSGLDEFKGLFASVSFGKQMGNFDIRGSLSMSGTHSSGYATSTTFMSGYFTENISGYYSSSSLTVGSGSSFSGTGYEYGVARTYAEGEIKTGFAAADFEVGYTPTLGNNFNVRLFAGLRALQFQSTFEGLAAGMRYYSSYFSGSTSPGTGFYSSQNSSYNSSYFEGTVESKFTAIGPRVGVQASTRFEGSNFGLSGSLATSVLFGKQTVKTDGYLSSYTSGSGGYSSNNGNSGSSGSSFYSSSYSTESSYNKTVLDLQASVGVDYYLNDNTVLTVGYQGEKLMEVAGDSSSPGTEIESMTHGAFVKLSGSF